MQILNEIAQHKIKIYEFPEVEEEEENKLHKLLRDRVPFAVVGANAIVEHDGKKVRGRKYPWGVAEGMYKFKTHINLVLRIILLKLWTNYLIIDLISLLNSSIKYVNTNVDTYMYMRIYAIFIICLFLCAVENLDHCDFIALRNMVVRTHVQDLKDVTNNVHYENFRCRTLAGLGVDGKPIKASNK